MRGDQAYTRALIDIGYRDAAKHIDEIESFLFTAGPELRPETQQSACAASGQPVPAALDRLRGHA